MHIKAKKKKTHSSALMLQEINLQKLDNEIKIVSACEIINILHYVFNKLPLFNSNAANRISRALIIDNINNTVN